MMAEGYNRIAVTIDGRTVYWELPRENVAYVLSVLVQSFGPATEE